MKKRKKKNDDLTGIVRITTLLFMITGMVSLLSFLFFIGKNTVISNKIEDFLKKHKDNKVVITKSCKMIGETYIKNKDDYFYNVYEKYCSNLEIDKK